MSVYNLDLETYSEVDLKRVGSFFYARHPSTRVLCAAWSSGNGEVRTWAPGDPAPTFEAGATIHGYNIVGFDAEMWFHILTPRHGWPWPGWGAFSDSMHRAAYANLPGSLGEVAKALGTRDKDAIGAKLMQRLCKPARALIADADPQRLHTAANLTRLREYCREDVEAERALDPYLPELPDFEKKVAFCTAQMNRRGIAVDLHLVHRLIALAELYRGELREELVRVTRGRVDSETQLAAITRFCRDQGMTIPEGRGSMDAEAIDGYLDDETTPEACRTVLGIRRSLGKSALAKLDRLVDATCTDGRVRGLLQYYGAHQTGRWAGRLVQIQNLPRGVLEGDGYALARSVANYGNPADAYDLMRLSYGSKLPDVLNSLIRPCFIADPGTRRTLEVRDYSAIEGRILAWLAGEEHVLQAYRDGKRMYCVAAAGIYHEPYEAIAQGRKNAADPRHREFKAMDQVGKVAELALGYQGARGAFKAMAAGYGLVLPDAQIDSIVKAWRADRRRTVNLWYDTERAAIDAVRNPGTIFRVAGGRVAFRFDGTHLKMRLPSGRCLWYRNAHLREKYRPGFEDPKMALHFLGELDTGRFGLCDTYGGKLVENMVQAIARDILADAFVVAEESGIECVALVHDEIVAEVAYDGGSQLTTIMDTLPPWTEGLPMSAAGFMSDHYMK